MEWIKCPICGKEELLLSSLKKVSESRILCENDYYIHVSGIMVDYLMRTDKAIREEKEKPTSQFVLN